MRMNLQPLRQIPEIIMLPFLAVLSLLFFGFTSPREIAPAMLIVGFILVFAMLLYLARLVLRVTGLKDRLRRVQYKGMLLGMSALPTVLLAMQSIGQLTIRDVLTLLLLCLAGYFYVSRLSAS